MAINEADEPMPWFNLAANDSCWLHVTVSEEAKETDHSNLLYDNMFSIP